MSFSVENDEILHHFLFHNVEKQNLGKSIVIFRQKSWPSVIVFLLLIIFYHKQYFLGLKDQRFKGFHHYQSQQVCLGWNLQCIIVNQHLGIKNTAALHRNYMLGASHSFCNTNFRNTYKYSILAYNCTGSMAHACRNSVTPSVHHGR